MEAVGVNKDKALFHRVDGKQGLLGGVVTSEEAGFVLLGKDDPGGEYLVLETDDGPAEVYGGGAAVGLRVNFQGI